MAEYKSNQCPECGCEVFKHEPLIAELYEFLNDNFVAKLFLYCYDCRKEINESESIKQGKIILAD